MRRLVSHIACVTLWCVVAPGVAKASNFDYLPVPFATMPAQIVRPPRGYQKPATFTIHTLASVGEVVSKCHDLGASPADLGCEKGGEVWVVNPCLHEGERWADLVCHEQAHVELWPGDHPSKAPTSTPP